MQFLRGDPGFNIFLQKLDVIFNPLNTFSSLCLPTSDKRKGLPPYNSFICLPKRLSGDDCACILLKVACGSQFNLLPNVWILEIPGINRHHPPLHHSISVQLQPDRGVIRYAPAQVSHACYLANLSCREQYIIDT